MPSKEGTSASRPKGSGGSLQIHHLLEKQLIILTFALIINRGKQKNKDKKKLSWVKITAHFKEYLLFT